MKKLVMLSVLFLSACSQFQSGIVPEETNSDTRVTSVAEPIIFQVEGVDVVDEIDPRYKFIFESKIAAPLSSQTVFNGLVQATGVSLLGSDKMVISYNTKDNTIEGGIDIVNIADLAHPVVLKSFILPKLEFADSKIVGNKIYLSGIEDNKGAVLVTIDLTNIGAPVIADKKTLSSFYATSLSLSGSNLLVTTGDAGGHVISFNLDANGIPVEQYRDAYQNALYVQHYKSGYAVLFDDGGVTKIGYKNKTTNALTKVAVRSTHFESPARFDIAGDTAYVSTADEEVVVAVNLTTMTKVQTINVTGRGNGVKQDNGLLFTASGAEGFKLFDVRDLNNVQSLGRFDFLDQGAGNNVWTYTMGLKRVVIVADGLGGVKILSQDLSTYAGSCKYATSVVSYNPVGTIDPTRKISSKALGAPQGDVQTPIEFVSLGKTGSIVLTFDYPVQNVAGKDLRVYETSWGNQTFSQYPEQAEVYGSNDGTTWTYLGLVKNDNGNPSLGEVELGTMTEAKFIKLVDKTTFSSSDGYDVDAIECLNQPIAPPPQPCDPTYEFVKNPSFEIQDARVGVANGQPLQGLAAWDVYDSLPSLVTGVKSWYRESGAGIEIQKAGVSSNVFDGNYLVELDSNPNSTYGSNSNTKMTQDISLVPGNYILQFHYKPRTSTPNDSRMLVSLDGVQVSDQNSTDTSQWQTVTVPVNTVTGGTHKLSFQGAGTENTLGALLDLVSLKRVCN